MAVSDSSRSSFGRVQSEPKVGVAMVRENDTKGKEMIAPVGFSDTSRSVSTAVNQVVRQERPISAGFDDHEGFEVCCVPADSRFPD